MRILIVDGQGGRIGAALTEGILRARPDADLVAVGTNTAATQAMRKAGAAACATGENPVLVNAARADVITGPIGVVAPDSLLGEITPRMAEAISGSAAKKILVPVSRCNILVAGVNTTSLSESIEKAVELLLSIETEGQNGGK
ncbi:MAG: DUF3842 family protein [Oscillospiraceae bacterium]|nr:DUF3842 family protein [Oscillospiraceae bacterium]